MKDYKN